MEETYLLNHPGVKKKILSGGAGHLPHFPTGTKLVFHFQTLLDDFERTVIDDSRLTKRPAEIFVGKMFKMEVWEVLLTSMRIGEVAEFWCDAMHTGLYPMVSKGMRLVAQGKDPLEGQRHTCGMGNMFHYHSTGYPELDELMRTPQPLIFIMELLQVGDPMSYQRESWMMEKDEKMETVPILHMQGNALVKLGRFSDAASKYKEAVLLLKTVQSREMPGDEDYINLGRLIIPLELNYCQCMLELEEYYEVIEHTTELLEKHKGCVKGYYKRAKAHAAVWNEKEARRDFNMVANLDITLTSLVHKELKALSERMKEKYWEEKEKYWNMLEKKEEENKNDEEGEAEEAEEDEEEEKEKADESESMENTERLTTLTKDETKEEKGESQPEDVEVHQEVKAIKDDETVQVAADEEERSCSETQTNPNAPPKTEGKDWQQMLRLIMFLQDEGNFLVKENRYEEASTKFKEAIEYVDFLQYKQVDQKGEDWDSLEKVRLPLTLNLSQCMLELHQYQQVVELNNKLLKKHKGNFKAVYQRARAHSALCNEKEAQRDFAKVERLDPDFKPLVRQELKRLGESIRTMHRHQSKTYWDTTQEKWGPGGTKAKAEKKIVTFAQKATEERNCAKENKDRKVEEQKSAEEPGTAKKEGVNNEEIEEKNPDVKIESKEERASSERVDSEKKASIAVQEDMQAAPDNRVEDEDSDAAPTSKATDNVVSKRSGSDQGRTKVKCQSTAAQDPSGASQGNKATITGNGGTQSESTNGSKLSAADPEATGEVEDAERLEKQTEEGGESNVNAGSETAAKTSDKQPAEAARAASTRVSARNVNSATKPSTRKHKKKKK